MAPLLLLVVLVLAGASAKKSRDILTVLLPKSLAHDVGSDGVIPAMPALFGKFYYGRALDAPIYTVLKNATEPDLVACSPVSSPSFENGKHQPYIAIVQRGGNCTFVKKARNVQDAGASALVVVNDNANEPNYMGVSPSESGLSMSVDIPVFMIRQAPGESIFKALKENTMVRGQFRVLKPNPIMNQKVNVELYLRVDTPPVDFMQTFAMALQSLGATVEFSAHYILDDPVSADPLHCTNNKRYCAQSKDAVEETLRQLCIFENEGWQSWNDYYKIWSKECGSKQDHSRSCFQQFYTNVESVDQCIKRSGGLDNDDINILLEKQRQDPRELHYSPTLVINDAIFESQLACNSVHDCAPLSFLCMMFSDDNQPAACFTSSACQSFGEIPDVCGTCRPVGDVAAVLDPAQCLISSSTHQQRRIPFAAILVVFLVASLLMSLVIVAINRRVRRAMRREVHTIMSDYTPLHDTEIPYFFSPPKDSYEIPAA